MHSAVIGSAPWTPRRLSPLAWWRADLGVSLASGAVAGWGDQSGRGVHLSQGTPASRPTYVASGARKGQPCVESTATGQLLVSATVTLPREIAIWVVTGTVATAGFALTHLVGSNRSHYLYLPGVAAFSVTNAVGSLYFARFSSWAYVNRGLLGIYDGASIDVYSNNVNANGSVTGAPVPASNQSGTIGIFCSPDLVNPSAMQIYEGAIFPASSLTSATARQRLRDYELARYG